jgi:hypothetical protein
MPYVRPSSGGEQTLYGMSSPLSSQRTRPDKKPWRFLMSIDENILERVLSASMLATSRPWLDALRADVRCANGLEGGYLRGREAVRSYWTRQWAMIDPGVEPTGFSSDAEGEVVVEVHQTVRDLQGTALVDQMVGDVFRPENGLITRFDIREP